MEYKDTIFLPKSTFEMRANLPTKEPKILDEWDKEKIFYKLREKSKGREKFVLHDGPPYANGHIHIGTALNKTLTQYTPFLGYICFPGRMLAVGKLINLAFCLPFMTFPFICQRLPKASETFSN